MNLSKLMDLDQQLEVTEVATAAPVKTSENACYEEFSKRTAEAVAVND